MHTYFGNVSGDDGHLSQRIHNVVEPSGQKSTTGGRKVHACDGAQLYGQALQDNGKDVAEENDEEELEAIGCTCCDVGGIITRIDFNSLAAP